MSGKLGGITGPSPLVGQRQSVGGLVSILPKRRAAHPPENGETRRHRARRCGQ